jgi:hypothetical protein
LIEPVRIAADPSQRVAQFLTAGVDQIEHRAVEGAGHAAAADAGQPIFARLLGQEIDHLKGVIESRAGIAQDARDIESRRDAGDAVESAAGRHGIAVRADRDHAKRGVTALDPPDQIA